MVIVGQLTLSGVLFLTYVESAALDTSESSGSDLLNNKLSLAAVICSVIGTLLIMLGFIFLTCRLSRKNKSKDKRKKHVRKRGTTHAPIISQDKQTITIMDNFDDVNNDTDITELCKSNGDTYDTPSDPIVDFSFGVPPINNSRKTSIYTIDLSDSKYSTTKPMKYNFRRNNSGWTESSRNQFNEIKEIDEHSKTNSECISVINDELNSDESEAETIENTDCKSSIISYRRPRVPGSNYISPYSQTVLRKSKRKAKKRSLSKRSTDEPHEPLRQSHYISPYAIPLRLI